jgi:peptide/nickel transport system ATP-binding protein
MNELLQVQGIRISYRTSRCSEMPAVTDVSFDIRPGEALGLLGESGCGKTTTALSLLRLLPYTARVIRGRIYYRGIDLLHLSESDMGRLRGKEISLIFQEPAIALNPVMCVGDQIAEVIRTHRHWEARRCRMEAEKWLRRVELGDGSRFYRAYPHELSGGQNQRVLIAQALSCGPSLVVADEPTSGLDARTQAGILDLLMELKTKLQTAFLIVSHHPGVLARLADRVLVMYAGRIVEEGELHQVYQNPRHPYTAGLMKSVPLGTCDEDGHGRRRLDPIPGHPPNLNELPPGCPFAPRCPVKMDVCSCEEPGIFVSAGGRRVRCFAYGN